ncbi:Olfactory Receptor 51V1 [Manis pentadactyla]|nr:Olfactory Receptor 51V1 [Manis pentadactyla]
MTRRVWEGFLSYTISSKWLERLASDIEGGKTKNVGNVGVRQTELVQLHVQLVYQSSLGTCILHGLLGSADTLEKVCLCLRFPGSVQADECHSYHPSDKFEILRLMEVKQIPLRFKSETTPFLLLYFVRKKGEAVSTGVIQKSILSHGLLDPIGPWRHGSEIFFKVSSRFDRVEKLYITHWCFTALLSIPSVQADGVLRFGRINPSGSEPKDILCIAHPIMSPVLFHSSKDQLKQQQQKLFVICVFGLWTT